MKTCSRCVLNDEYYGIEFDSNGLCNYCRFFEPYKKRLEDKKKLAKLFRKRINRVKGKYEYDCLIGISGGKDSSYVLYMLKNKYKLKVLTYTFDNNFLSNYAKNNIKNLIDEFGVDHFFYKPDWTFHKKAYQYMMDTQGIPCKACSIGAYGTSFKFAFEKNIPLVIHGRSPAQMFREFIPSSKDPTIPFIENNLSEYNKKNQIKTLREVLQRMQGLSSEENSESKRVLKKMRQEFFPKTFKVLTSKMVPEFLGFFIYHEYDEKQIKDFLEKNINWKRPEKDSRLTHADCLIHDAVEYIQRKKFGYTLLTPELSVLIRQGKMTKKEAKRIIEENEKTIVKPEESLKILCSSLDIDYTSFLNEINKRELDAKKNY